MEFKTGHDTRVIATEYRVPKTGYSLTFDLSVSKIYNTTRNG